MLLEEHCKRSLKMFGGEYSEVHQWLDELSTPRNKPYHRKYRHHLQGVIECANMFGRRTIRVAQQHILDDFQGFLSNVPEAGDYNRDFWERYKYYLEQKEIKQA
jgi:hypothetical protein